MERVDASEVDPVSLLTRRYQTSILQLASTSDTCVAWQTAQYVLDHLWIDNNSNEKPKEEGQQTAGTIYGCQECGSLIHPGWKGTSLRVNRIATSSSSRSLRRRLQRKKKQLALSQLKQAKDQSNRRKQQQQQVPNDAAAPPRMVLLQDEPNLILDRHHLVVGCGRCRAKVRLKGLRRQQREPQHKKAVIRHAAAKAKVPTTKFPEKAAAAVVQDSLDFVQLPPAPSNPTPLTVQSGRKKKKKKPPPPASKLMNFLSSLND